jgi:hypothetical protein
MKLLFKIITGILIIIGIAKTLQWFDDATTGTTQQAMPPGEPKQPYGLVIIDSCEYIEVNSTLRQIYTLTHKGNCKFCRKKLQP